MLGAIFRVCRIEEINTFEEILAKIWGFHIAL